MAGLTLDSGAVIGYERGDLRVLAYLKETLERGLPPTVPSVVIAETYRGGPRSARISRLLRFATTHDLDEALARDAGELRGRCAGSTTIDAIVVASAATRSDAILTSDPGDIEVLAAHYPAVRVIAI